MLQMKCLRWLPSLLLLLVFHQLPAQTNLLLNGNFEDINTCTEYQAECGVEGWFYLKEVKAQMLSHEGDSGLLGNNSYGIYSNWGGYTGFVPMIGTIIPCRMQAGKQYTFRGWIKASLHPKLLLKPGIALGPRFYVPNRKFITDLRVDSMENLTATKVPEFYQFEYHFTAKGNEKYLTFGTLIHTDTSGAKKAFFGSTVVMVELDHFELVPDDPTEILCDRYLLNKELIYRYDSRHKEMDYALFGRGDLEITFPGADTLYFTRKKIIPPPPKTDTLKLSDVLFDFNKAVLKPEALKMLDKYFTDHNNAGTIDSIYVEGHTDSVGSDTRNMTLSRERSESVKQWLEKKQISPVINIHPFGRSRPVATNNTPQGRALNRRVELVLFRKSIK